MCAGPAGGAAGGEQPGGKCEFSLVCLTAIKAVMPARPAAAGLRLPGNPLSWVRFGSGGGRRPGGGEQTEEAQPAALGVPASLTAHLASLPATAAPSPATPAEPPQVGHLPRRLLLPFPRLPSQDEGAPQCLQSQPPAPWGAVI